MSTLLASIAPAPSLAFFTSHEAFLNQAVEALFNRGYWAAFSEMPQTYGEAAEAEGKQRYDAQLGSAFSRLKQQHDALLESDEESPYTRTRLGIRYPHFAAPETYVQHAQEAFPAWREASTEARIGVLLEALQRLSTHFFELAHATMHTTGQAWMMAFQAGAPHAADRALEAVAMAFSELKRFPNEVKWVKPMGKFDAVVNKQVLNVPNGITLAIGCSTFPVWNSAPGIFAALATGNPVIVKPHPLAIYPLALVVAVLQEVLVEAGFDAHTIQLAPDTLANPITKTLAEHPDVKQVDFTGSTAFGTWIESLGKTCFTEKAGVNSVILDSVDDLGKVAKHLAFSASLYSSQMCTAPQNFFIPQGGIKTAEGHATYEEVVKALTDAIAGLAGHEKAGPAIYGALQRDETLQRVEKAKGMGAKVLLEPFAIKNPDFPNARTSSPVVLEVPAERVELYSEEMFGPILMVIPTRDTAHSIELASQLARNKGAISCGAYSTDPQVQQRILVAMAEAFTPVALNLVGQVYMNQNAAFGDFHVSGGNPSGNASFTDPGFVVRRFTKVGIKAEG